MRRLLTALLVFSLVFIPVPSAAKVSPLAPVRPLWVQSAHFDTPDIPGQPPALSYDQICTVNSINEQIGLWITAAHCLEDGPVFVEEVNVDPSVRGPLHATNIVDIDKDLDIGILVTPDYAVTAFHLGQPVAVGDNIAMMGYPLGLRTAIYLQGYVSALRVNFEGYGVKIVFGMPACGGNSGSAVLNGDGELISVLQLGFGRPCAAFTAGIAHDDLAIRFGKYFGQ